MYISFLAVASHAQGSCGTNGKSLDLSPILLPLRYADDTTLMAESEEELKNLLMKVKGESEKAGLKLNIQKTKIMASSPITSWQMCSAKSLQLCPTLCNPMDYSLPGSSVHGIF